ncbi:MAG: pantetheine-phosphate adenylyltransferase [Bacillota bacterium]
MRIAVYPGTFDPVTNGHLDIIQRAARMFNKLIIAVARDNNKKALFTLDERTDLLRKVTSQYPNVTVESYSGLSVEFVKSRGACAMVRGLRAISDFEYELQIYLMNKKLSEDVETVFLMTASDYSFISSSMIKQVANLGGCIKGLVPELVEEAIVEKLFKKRRQKEKG